MQIGSLNTKSTSEQIYSNVEHRSLEWSEDMSTLTIKSVTLMKGHTSYPYNTSSPIVTYISQSTLSLDNGQLLMNGRMLSLLDMEQLDGLQNYSCVLNKNQN